ncbi:MAG: hypothetical protein KTR31_13660 [Myxococcales bacterium]|nr:hypothetical protein [Myxococcales bacterium]
MTTGATAVDAKLARIRPALNQVSSALRSLAEHGLQRATQATVREISAVAQTAHHARLVRLQRDLDALATAVRRYLERDPAFRPAKFVELVSRVWLLLGAIERALSTARAVADLEPITGVPRRRYDLVDEELHVVAVAASGWVTDSGYVGVTSHLYDLQHQRFLQASMVRPDRMVGPDPTRMLSMTVSDVTPTTMQELCHGAWTLGTVKLSSDLRVSLHGELVIVPTAPVGRSALDPLVVTHAAQIVDRLQSSQLDPVAGVGSTLVLLEPVVVSDVVVDDTQARATAVIRDGQGARLSVTVSIRPENDLLIDNLRALMDEQWRPDGLVARATVAGRSLLLTPLTAVYAQPVTLGRRVGSTHLVHLTIESLARASR